MYILSFNIEDEYYLLFFIILKKYYFIEKKAISYHRLFVFDIANIIIVNVNDQFIVPS